MPDAPPATPVGNLTAHSAHYPTVYLRQLVSLAFAPDAFNRGVDNVLTSSASACAALHAARRA